jgi:hypothetical protein
VRPIRRVANQQQAGHPRFEQDSIPRVQSQNGALASTFDRTDGATDDAAPQLWRRRRYANRSATAARENQSFNDRSDRRPHAAAHGFNFR